MTVLSLFFKNKDIFYDLTKIKVKNYHNFFCSFTSCSFIGPAHVEMWIIKHFLCGFFRSIYH